MRTFELDSRLLEETISTNDLSVNFLSTRIQGMRWPSLSPERMLQLTMFHLASRAGVIDMQPIRCCLSKHHGVDSCCIHAYDEMDAQKLLEVAPRFGVAPVMVTTGNPRALLQSVPPSCFYVFSTWLERDLALWTTTQKALLSWG